VKPPALRAHGPALLGLALLSVLFWKLRIFDLGVDPHLALKNVDLYNAHVPMMRYGFESLRAGRLPLWNPHQFCGEPFLAVYYPGIFYPLNLVYLLLPVEWATELSILFHMLLAGAGMWWLARRLGIDELGALCAALTFMWSGRLVHMTDLPAGLCAASWMPLSVVLVDRVLRHERRAMPWLTVAITAQLLVGAVEFVWHTTQVCALFVLLRLVAERPEGRAALAGAGRILACAGLGLLLAAPQLLPTLELVQLTERAPGSLDTSQLLQGAIPPMSFLRAAVAAEGDVHVGTLALVAGVLALGFRGRGLAFSLGAATALAAAALVFGGSLARVYTGMPIVGNLFRGPHKFLDVYAFGQALLVGLAVARLGAWRGLPRSRLWSHPSWIAALVVAAAALTWSRAVEAGAGFAVTLVALLLAYGITSRRWLRGASLGALALLQAASLFSVHGNPRMRPASRPEVFWTHADLLERIRSDLGHQRLYVSPRFWKVPGLAIKQGTFQRIDVVNDYEPLSLRRYAEFFGQVSPWRARDGVFNGRFTLRPRMSWKLLDLTGTRYFLMRRDEVAAAYMTDQAKRPASRFRLLDDGNVQLFERVGALPRAWFVPRARFVEPGAVLGLLEDPDFDPRREVLLEGPPGSAPPPTPPGPVEAEVSIARYEPERVVISVTSAAPGYLVLGDLHYPGWRAFLDDREVPIHRANHLFRAVSLDPGSHRVRFEFRPSSFRTGTQLALGTLLALAAVAWWRHRHGR
jgi:hypothetical protein